MSTTSSLHSTSRRSRVLPAAQDPASTATRPAGSAVAIKAEGITKSFDGTAALNGVDLEVRPGELLALLGPSGSGKTTLLRLVAGLEFPTGGRILFGNDDATHMPVRERRVGFVFQSYALFRHMNVAANIAYGLRARTRHERPSADEIGRRVAALLDLVQLEGYGARFPSQLSGGQRQRVALARALAVEPRVLLLDEPFGALDAQVRRDLRRWLRELHDRTGHTTLFVTHDQEEALGLADRVAVLSQGRVEQVGTPDDILDRPATSFVAGFVGEAVRLPVEVAGPWIRLGPHALRATADSNPSGSAEIFLRPRDVVIAGTDASAIPARVVAVRRTGPGRRAQLALGDGLPGIEIELPPGHPAARGDTLPVKISTIRLFASR